MDYKQEPQTSCPIATDQLCDLRGVTLLRARFPPLANEGKDPVYGSPSSHRGDTSQDPSKHKGAKRTHSVKERAGLGSAEKAGDVATAKRYCDDDDYN